MFRLDKLLPESWGLAMPFSVQYGRTSAAPYYINRTDVRADALTNLRRPGGSSTLLQLNLRRVRRGTTFLAHTLLDPWTVAATSESRNDVSSLAASNVSNRILRVGYLNAPGSRTTAGAPGFLVRLVESLPSWIRDSDFGRALRGSRLRWNPYQLTFSSTISKNVAERYVYRVPVELAGDTAIRPLPSINYLWRNQFGLELRPFNSMGLLVNYNSTRDLQDYGDSTTIGKLLQFERRSLFGQDVGFERHRQLSTGFNVAPVVASWLRPRFSWNTNYTFDRNPNRTDVVREVGDTAGAYRVPESVLNSRVQEVGATVDLARLARGIAGDSSFVTKLFRGVLPADLSHALELRSGFDRVPFDTDLGYRLALGGIDEFRVQNGIPATSANRTTTTVISGGVRLPLSLQVRLNYRNVGNSAWQRRGDGQTEVRLKSREWPSMNVTWGYAPPAGVRKVLTSVTAQAQYRVQETARVQPLVVVGGGGAEAGTGEVRTENNTRLLSPSLTLGWFAGITTTARFSTSRTEGVSSGNVTRSNRDEWGATLNFAFRPPESLVRLPNRIQTTLAYSTSDLGVCIVTTGSPECRVVSDSRRNQFDFRMDTGFSTTLRGGLSFSYILSDQRHLSQTMRQYVFTIFGDITLRAGRLR
jgi:hypothetical protein